MLKRSFVFGCLMLTGCHADLLTEPDASTWTLTSESDAPRDMRTIEDLADVTLLLDMGEPDTGISCPALQRELCVAQDTSAWDGDCGESLGFFFDGARCRRALGCPCANSKACPAFDSMEACTTACGQAGMCNADALPWVTPYTLETCSIMECTDGIALCMDSDEEPTDRVNSRFAGTRDFYCQPPGPNSICEFGIDCSESWCCTSQPDDGIEERPELEHLCGVSLSPDVLGMVCIRLE